MALATFDRCRASHSVIYTVSSVVDVGGKTVNCERLLLPFGTGSRIAHIVASLQPVSIEGAFMRQNIFRQRIAPCELFRCGLRQPVADHGEIGHEQCATNEVIGCP